MMGKRGMGIGGGMGNGERMGDGARGRQRE